MYKNEVLYGLYEGSVRGSNRRSIIIRGTLFEKASFYEEPLGVRVSAVAF